MLLSLVFCVVAITLVRQWRRVGAVLRTPRTLLLLGLAGAVVYVNWQVYVIAIGIGAVVDAALGYFITPIVTVLLGVLVLRERMRPAQWAAVGVSVAAILVIAIANGTVPWIALALAASFGVYGFLKKRVGSRVDAVTGLAFETAWLAPIAAVQLVIVGVTTGITFGHHGVGQAVLLLLAGVVTAIPLLLFAGAARRLPLVAVGLTQYVTPLLQFVIGVAVLHEEMPLARWIGFALVWLALLVLTVDLVVAARRDRIAASTIPGTGATPR